MTTSSTLIVGICHRLQHRQRSCRMCNSYGANSTRLQNTLESKRVSDRIRMTWILLLLILKYEYSCTKLVFITLGCHNSKVANCCIRLRNYNYVQVVKMLSGSFKTTTPKNETLKEKKEIKNIKLNISFGPLYSGTFPQLFLSSLS